MARMLTLLTFRPGFAPPWSMAAHLTHLTLNRFAPQQIERMATHVAGGKTLPAEVIQQVVTKTDGVPLFVEELTKTVLESGLLEEHDDHYALTGLLPALAIPATLHDALMARLDRLDTAKTIAQLGATLGRTFAYELLQAISPLDETTLQQALARLVEAELLAQRGTPPQATYTFKHALIQDVAYQSLLKRTRQQQHQQIARVMEERFPETGTTQPELLAHHYTEAGLHAQAVDYWHKAGQRDNERSAYREAVACFEHALDALRHLPERRDTQELAIDLRLELRSVLLMLAEFGGVLNYLREAETLAEALDDQRRLGRICSYMAHHFWLVGDYDEAITCGQRALALAAASGDVTLQAEVQANSLGQVYFALGDYRQAMDCFRQTMTSFEGALLDERVALFVPSVRPRIWMARCLGELGEFTEGIAYGEEAARIAEEANHLNSTIFTQYILGSLALHKGDLHQAIPQLVDVLVRCRAAAVTYWLPLIATALGSAYARLGEMDEALPLLEQAVEQVPRRGAESQALLTWLGEAYLLAGRQGDATHHALHALEIARERKARGAQTRALRLLGEIALHRDPPEIEEAEVHYKQALDLANELGMRPLQAHCHLGLGTLYTKMGRLEPAHTELSAAIELYRAMEMTFWLPEAEEALAQVEGQ